VEVLETVKAPPVSTFEIERLANIPLNQINLFDLSLEEIEKRLLSNSWIKNTQLQKKFPQTITISVEYRNPIALFQHSNGSLWYIDKEGLIFREIERKFALDLPIFSGFIRKSHSTEIKKALNLYQNWKVIFSKNNDVEFLSLDWSSKEGFRALISYRAPGSPLYMRSEIKFGINMKSDTQMARLRELQKVLSYLSKKHIAAHQVLLEEGKKIVVKTARSS